MGEHMHHKVSAKCMKKTMRRVMGMGIMKVKAECADAQNSKNPVMIKMCPWMAEHKMVALGMLVAKVEPWKLRLAAASTGTDIIVATTATMTTVTTTTTTASTTTMDLKCGIVANRLSRGGPCNSVPTTSQSRCKGLGSRHRASNAAFALDPAVAIFY